MKCPKCREDALKVIDTRHTIENSVRRQRKCLRCGYRFTTFEISMAQKAEYERAVKTPRNIKRKLMKMITELGG